MIRYGKLGYVALNVPDPIAALPFYTEQFGTAVVGEPTPDRVMLATGVEHHTIVLRRAPTPGLAYVAWGFSDEAALTEAVATLTALHAQTPNAVSPPRELAAEKCQALGVERAVRFSDALGVTHEWYTGMRERPRHTPGADVHFLRLLHVVLRVPDVHAAARFYRDHLGFVISDEVKDASAFMRPWPTSDHHGFALMHGKTVGFHHAAWMVESIDDIGKAVNRFQKTGVPIVFGPGRHHAANTLFLYFLDPFGLTLEYSEGMEQFPPQGGRPARMLERSPETLDRWGSIPDPRLGATGNIAPPDSLLTTGQAG